jgi:hypothetical protein
VDWEENETVSHTRGTGVAIIEKDIMIAFLVMRSICTETSNLYASFQKHKLIKNYIAAEARTLAVQWQDSENAGL